MSEQPWGSPRQPPPPSRWRKLLRRQLPLIVLLAGLGYLIVRLLQAQPISLEVVYRYGDARQGLVGASMRYLRGGEEERITLQLTSDALRLLKAFTERFGG